MKRFVMIIAILFLLSFRMAGLALSAMAEEENIPEGDTYYTCVKIQYGDTLDTLASEYNQSEYLSDEDYKKSIRNINNLSGDTLYPGAYLTLAIYQ
ncbi:MAG: LysM peptidoglycan-binding domain-containing protein [Johnsonella sp.]|nr:LysM peptidoglycan-binding domain-containing protein [Johnsonella sp.]